MPQKVENRKLLTAVVGWALALTCVISVALYIGHVATRDLAVMLCVGGEPLCRVEDRSVVEEALLLLSK